MGNGAKVSFEPLRGGLGYHAGVNNLTNQRPDVNETFCPAPAAGRFFHVGLRYQRQACAGFLAGPRRAGRALHARRAPA